MRFFLIKKKTSKKKKNKQKPNNNNDMHNTLVDIRVINCCRSELFVKLKKI